MDPQREATAGGLLGASAAVVGALFGIELTTLCCALVGAWIGAPLARRLEAPGEADKPPATTLEQARKAVSALLSYVAAAISSAVFATLLAGEVETPGGAGLRNALAVGIAIGFYVLVAKFIENPLGFIGWIVERFIGSRRPPPGPPPPPGATP